MFLNLFNALVRKKARVLRVFWVFWLLLGILFIPAALSVYSADINDYIFWYGWAVWSGKTALVFFTITLLPGIFRRFGRVNRVLGLIMIFRRQFGISVFLLASFHFLTVAILPKLKNGAILKYSTFELYGLSAAILLLFLFITSNDWSQVRLGKFWWLLHRAVYVIMWLIFLHVALQRISVWTVIASILVVSEMAGIIYSNLKKRLKD